MAGVDRDGAAPYRGPGARRVRYRLSDGDQKRLDQWHDVTIEEHPGDGHFVHLVDPARFAASLQRFVDHCLATGR